MSTIDEPALLGFHWKRCNNDSAKVSSFGYSPKANKFHTHCLIPKVNNLEHMSDPRPTALCNVIYNDML